jgi:hypothetical protein
MANLIQNNSKLVKLTESQIYQSQTMQINKTDNSGDVDRQPKTIRITKDQSGFGFNVRGQISGKFAYDKVRDYFSEKIHLCKRLSVRMTSRIQKLLNNISSDFLHQYTTCTLRRYTNPFVFHSWRTTEVHQRRALCTTTTCICNSRKWFSGASWNQKRRQNTRSVSTQNTRSCYVLFD